MLPLVIHPPLPSPIISVLTAHRLRRFADWVSTTTAEVIADHFSDIAASGLLGWLTKEGGLGEVASAIGYPSLGFGFTRYVFGMEDYVIKIEIDSPFLGTGKRTFAVVEAVIEEYGQLAMYPSDNAAERDSYHAQPRKNRVWLTRPYALSMDQTVIIMERLEPTEGNTPELRNRIDQILKQEEWMEDIFGEARDKSWYNWGYRRGDERKPPTPVLLDYGAV